MTFGAIPFALLVFQLTMIRECGLQESCEIDMQVDGCRSNRSTPQDIESFKALAEPLYGMSDLMGSLEWWSSLILKQVSKRHISFPLLFSSKRGPVLAKRLSPLAPIVVSLP